MASHVTWVDIMASCFADNCATPELLLLHPFNGLFSRTSWVGRYRNGRSSLHLIEARDDGVLGWQWHQLDHMQTICTTPTPHHLVYTGWMLFLTPNQQCPSTEGTGQRLKC